MAPRPTSRDVTRGVMGKLRLDRNITSEMLPSITFSPTIGIAAKRIDTLGTNISSFKVPLTRAIDQVMSKSFQENFAKGGRPEKWEPLSDATLEIRARQGFAGSKVLIRSGDLMRTVGTRDIWRITDVTAIITGLPDNVSYGAIHQGGYEGASMKVRMRRFGGDPKKALESLMDEQVNILERGTMFRGSAGRQERFIGGGGTMRRGAPEIPQRQFIMFQDDDEDAVTEVFIKWLGEEVRKAWPPTGGARI
jgi:phage gpG-like protein